MLMARQYAVVAYIKDPVGVFVEQLRRDLYPQHAHLPAHITILPPRPLNGNEDSAIDMLRRRVEVERCYPFTVDLGDVESFSPITPTVFIRVARSAHRFRDLHEELNTGPLQCDEPWFYTPHLTVVKMPDFPAAEQALYTSRERWAGFHGKRSANVSAITFVREAEDDHWVDLATIPLPEKKVSIASTVDIEKK